MTDEQKRQLVAGLTEERRGYQSRLAAAEEADDSDSAAALKDRIAQVDRQLKALGVKQPKKETNVCDVCGFESKSAQGLAVHQRSHEEDES